MRQDFYFRTATLKTYMSRKQRLRLAWHLARWLTIGTDRMPVFLCGGATIWFYLTPDRKSLGVSFDDLEAIDYSWATSYDKWADAPGLLWRCLTP